MEKFNGNPRYIAHCSAVNGVIITIIAGLVLIGAIITFIVDEVWFGVVLLLVAAVLAIIGCLRILSAMFNKIIFYDNKVVERKGIINTKEKSSILTGIVGVSVEQSLFGKLFNYGDIVIDKVGKGWDISTEHIAKPYEFKKYLETIIDKTEVNNQINTFLAN